MMQTPPRRPPKVPVVKFAERDGAIMAGLSAATAALDDIAGAIRGGLLALSWSCSSKSRSNSE